MVVLVYNNVFYNVLALYNTLLFYILACNDHDGNAFCKDRDDDLFEEALPGKTRLKKQSKIPQLL